MTWTSEQFIQESKMTREQIEGALRFYGVTVIGIDFIMALIDKQKLYFSRPMMSLLTKLQADNFKIVNVHDDNYDVPIVIEALKEQYGIEWIR